MFLYAGYQEVRDLQRQVRRGPARYFGRKEQYWESIVKRWRNQPMPNKYHVLSGCFLGSLCVEYFVFDATADGAIET